MPTVRQTSPLTAQVENASVDQTLSRIGLAAIMDFWVYHSLAGNMFQVRAGTITTPVVGQVPITNSAAEACVDAPAGGMVMIASHNISLRLAAGSLFEIAGKSVGSASSAGTAFTPLTLKFVTGARAAAATARVQPTGNVTVTAELATTTRRNWSWSQPIAAGAWPTWYDYVPRECPVLSAGACYYLQVGGAGTAPSYYMSFDFLDDPTSALL